MRTIRPKESILKSSEFAVHICKTNVDPTVGELRATHMFVAYSCNFEVADHTQVSITFD